MAHYMIVGREASAWPGVLGRHGVGNMNSNGLLLLTKCTELDLAVKVKVYTAAVLTILLYGGESWTLYQWHC